MVEVPALLALAAGMLAAVNPCGFALLPVYLSLLVLDGERPARGVAVRRALVATASMTAGFVAVFGMFGLAVAPVAAAVAERLPWFTIALGLTVAVLGGWLLAGRQLPGFRTGGRGVAVSRSVPRMAGFGAAYALASLGCTVGPFLAIVAATLRSGSVLAGLGLFVAYAVGMGLLVGVAAMAVALADSALLVRLRRSGPVVARAGGAALLLAGAYVAWYGWYELRLAGSGTADDPVVATAGAVQRWLSGTVDRAGVPVLAGLFVLLLAAGLAAGRARRRDNRTDTPSGATGDRPL